MRLLTRKESQQNSLSQITTSFALLLLFLLAWAWMLVMSVISLTGGVANHCCNTNRKLADAVAS